MTKSIKVSEGEKAYNILNAIKHEYLACGLNYDHANAQSKEPLRILNEEMRKVANKFNRKHNKVTFASFMR